MHKNPSSISILEDLQRVWFVDSLRPALVGSACMQDQVVRRSLRNGFIRQIALRVLLKWNCLVTDGMNRRRKPNAYHRFG